MIEFVKPTIEHIVSVAADMRPADKAEVWASDHHTPFEALYRSWALSDLSVTVMSGDTPLVMIGLVKHSILTGSGVPWMLGSNAAMDHKSEFFSQTKPIVGDMLDVCPRLFNMVHSKNKASIRWLKWAGFTIEDPTPHGPEGDLFHRFYLER